MTTELRDLETRTQPLQDLPGRPANGHHPAEPRHKGILVIQSAKGPQRVSWHSDKHGEVEAARAAFSELRALGYRGYRLDSTTRVHEEVTQFDPTAEEVVMIMPLRGGAA